MPNYVPLKFPPGVFRNGTRYQSKGRWYKANLVRWSEGVMQPIGGWWKLKTTADADVSVTDPVRGLFGWRDNSQTGHLAIGVKDKCWAYAAGVLTDITIAAGFTSGNEDATTSVGNYNDGPYGEAAYNVGASAAGTVPIIEANSWQFDNFGEYLIANAYSDGKIYYWDTNPANNLVLTHAGAPTSVKGIVVTPERFVVGLGGTDYNAASAADARRVTWSDAEDYAEWNPAAASSQAGDFLLPGAGEIMCARRNRTETLIFTDVDTFAMRYIGGSLIYSFAQVGSNCGIASRRAVATVDGRAYWMGQRGFFVYDGFAQPLACEISDEIFTDMNNTQASKICAWANNAFHEIWFSYPSAGSSENNRIVVYNYLENHWSGPWGLGEANPLVRTDGIDKTVFATPVMADSEGGLYFHEAGEDYLDEDDVTDLASTISAESGPFEIGSGDNVMSISRYIPDENTLGDVAVTLYAALQPHLTQTGALNEESGSEDSQSLTLGALTDVRLTGRQVRLAIAQTNADWRFGEPRLEVIPRGRR